MIPGSGRSPGDGMAVRSSILVWKTPGTKEPGGLQPMGCKESAATHAHTSVSVPQGAQRRSWTQADSAGIYFCFGG